MVTASTKSVKWRACLLALPTTQAQHNLQEISSHAKFSDDYLINTGKTISSLIQSPGVVRRTTGARVTRYLCLYIVANRENEEATGWDLRLGYINMFLAAIPTETSLYLVGECEKNRGSKRATLKLRLNHIHFFTRLISAERKLPVLPGIKISSTSSQLAVLQRAMKGIMLDSKSELDNNIFACA
ncbi:uncharacterized protein LY89DRAFT_664864 [Mollisia scopiformis]|uniref:Uncharacterized protein n=1 Tax=Mollisia scopiformis TaxID=149040 RepID=A0A194XNE9_MOLSC|nr:uncharacterized protein LY89DRAFT_664864 [Mollisia scopiformis]KUJ21683.1 hypothetical protein LY89DRAFT_664864 [Mollisia scopiformis]